MTVSQILARLEALGSERIRAQNVRHGARGQQFGVLLGEIRKIAKELKTNHELALQLWATDIHEARLLATLILVPKKLSADELDRMVREGVSRHVADWLGSYVTKKHPDKEALRARWMADTDPMALRAGWSLTAERVAKDADGLDLAALLDRIEAEMGAANPETQWTMNTCLAQIGIHRAEHRDRAIAIGESLGVFRDYPTPKGCTSPFAPLWIAEMVRRQG